MTKISDLTAGTAATGAEKMPAVQSGSTVRLTTQQITDLAETSRTGTGADVRATSPVLVTPALGTPASGVVTNLTGTASININGTVGATTPATGVFTSGIIGASAGVIAASTPPLFTVSRNTTAAPMSAGLFGNAIAQFVGADGTPAQVVISSAGGNGSKIDFSFARGTIASPTATQSGDHQAAFEVGAHNGTSYVQTALMIATATENFAVGATGTRLDFDTTVNGTTGVFIAASIGAGLMINTTTDNGVGSLNATGSGTFGGARAGTQPALLTVNKATGAAPSSASFFGNAVAQFNGVDAANSQIVLTSNGTGYPGITYAQARGTSTAQTATQSGDLIGANFAYGYYTSGGTTYGGGAGFTMTATNNFTSTTLGTRVDIYAVPTGSAAAAIGASVGAGLMVGTTTDPGAGNYIGTGGALLYSGTAVPAGGTAGSGLKFSSTSNLGLFFGSGAPTLSAAQGSVYIRTDGSSTSTRFYVNTNGSTTWTNVTTAA